MGRRGDSGRDARARPRAVVMLIEAHGLRIELPRGWSGRVFKRPAGGATLHAGDFELPLDDGEFGDQSTAVMPPGATFVALTEYQPGAGLEPGKGLFASRRIPTALDPTSFSARGMAHPRPGQAGTAGVLHRGRPAVLPVRRGLRRPRRAAPATRGARASCCGRCGSARSDVGAGVAGGVVAEDEHAPGQVQAGLVHVGGADPLREHRPVGSRRGRGDLELDLERDLLARAVDLPGAFERREEAARAGVMARGGLGQDQRVGGGRRVRGTAGPGRTARWRTAA